MCARHMAPALSVVVTGSASCDSSSLAETLKSLRALGPLEGTLEILYIDRGSSSACVQEAHRYDCHVIQLPEETTRAASHNVGWRTSRGNLIFFIDTLGTVRSAFLTDAMQALQDPQVAVVCGPAIVNEADCCEALIRRSAIEEAQGFDKTLLAGDLPDLCRRLRAIDYTIVSLAYSLLEPCSTSASFSDWWSGHVMRGVAYAQVSERYAASSDQLWLREARRNLWVGGGLTVGVPLLLLAAYLCQCWLPLWVALVGILSLAFFIEGKEFALKESWWQKFRYAASQAAAQVPLFLGQCKFRLGLAKRK